jgi:phospholipid/cholesterol/gamma-HCH transport system ATP-binding protein
MHVFPFANSRVPAEALVDVRSVNFSYDARDPRPVLKGIDLQVPRGSMVAIMGASGSGKTTLLRLIGGQLRASEGEVLVAGRSMGRIDDAELYRLRRRMGMLFQFGALFTDLSVFENVAFPVREHTQLPERVVRDLVLLKLEAVGMRGAKHLMPAELSGGMARRIALARAVALDPLLVLYDEPFAGLDPIAMAVIGGLMRKLNDALGATSIVVSHDVVECLEIVDYVYLVADGVIVGHGTPDEMRRSQLPYVRQFVQGELDGPVPFHYPARDYGDDVRIRGGAGHA